MNGFKVYLVVGSEQNVLSCIHKLVLVSAEFKNGVLMKNPVTLEFLIIGFCIVIKEYGVFYRILALA